MANAANAVNPIWVLFGLFMGFGIGYVVGFYRRDTLEYLQSVIERLEKNTPRIGPTSGSYPVFKPKKKGRTGPVKPKTPNRLEYEAEVSKTAHKPLNELLEPEE